MRKALFYWLDSFLCSEEHCCMWVSSRLLYEALAHPSSTPLAPRRVSLELLSNPSSELFPKRQEAEHDPVRGASLILPRRNPQCSVGCAQRAGDEGPGWILKRWTKTEDGVSPSSQEASKETAVPTSRVWLRAEQQHQVLTLRGPKPRSSGPYGEMDKWRDTFCPFALRAFVLC